MSDDFNLTIQVPVTQPSVRATITQPSLSAVIPQTQLNVIALRGPIGPPGPGIGNITGEYPIFYDAGSGIMGIVSGYYVTFPDLTGASGALVAQISSAGAGVNAINGLSGFLTLAAVNPLFVSAQGQTLYISGSGLATSGDLTSVYSAIAQTGASLYSLITGNTGVAGLSTGVTSLNGVTGAIQLTGAGNITVLVSGPTITVSGLNSGEVSQAQLNALSGYVDAQVAATGQAAVLYTSGASGALQGQINLASGYANYLYGNNLVYRTGNQLISGIKTFATGIHVSGEGIYFDTPTNPAWQEGLTFYDQTEHALSYFNDANDVTVNLGQEMLVRVTNKSSVDIFDGQAVFISGAQGNRPKIWLAVASGISSENVIGVVTHDIPDNQNGYVTTQGVVRGIDMSAFTEGDPVYLSPTVPGGFTTVIPQSPNIIVKIGTVLNNSATIGSLYVDPEIIASHLAYLHDVRLDTETLAQGDLLSYDATGRYWTNVQNPSGALASGIAATGASLYATITGLSGQGANDYATKNELTNTGVILQGRIDSLSGFVVDASGGLETRIVQTGAAAISYATIYTNGVGANLSGNLFASGANLQGQISNLWGGTPSQTWQWQTGSSGNLIKNTPSGFILRNYLDNHTADLTVFNLTVEGTQTINNTTNLGVANQYIYLNVSGAPQDGGVVFLRSGSTASTLFWNESVQKWQAGLSGSESTIILASDTGQFASKTQLASTGDLLYNAINSSSGYAENIFVHRTGNELISGVKSFTGSVNIGTTGRLSDAALLHVSAGLFDLSGLYTSDIAVFSAKDTAPGLNIVSITNTGLLSYPTSRGVFKGTRARYTPTGIVPIFTGDQTVSLLGAAYDGYTNIASAGISFLVDGVVSSGVTPQAIIFEAGSGYANGLPTGITVRPERMRITSVGYVGVGTDNPTSRLHVYNNLNNVDPIISRFSSRRESNNVYSIIENLAYSGSGMAWFADSQGSFGFHRLGLGNVFTINSGNDFRYDGREFLATGIIRAGSAFFSGTGALATNIADIFYPRSNPSGYITGLAGTGSLATLAQLNSLSGFVVGASGGLETRIAQTGAANIGYANSAAINLSGTIGATGSLLYTLMTGASGQGVLDYATKIQLTTTGQTLYNLLVNASGQILTTVAATGSQAWNAANNNGINLSGNLATTGSNLYRLVTGMSGQGVADYATKSQLTSTGITLGAKIDSLSGFVGQVSGGLETRIFQTGASGILYASGVGVSTSGSLTQSGISLMSYANGVGTNLSGNLTLTGQTLQTRINSLSGFVIGASGGLETRIAQTGAAAVAHANGIGAVISGNLTQTGITLLARDALVSGWLSTGLTNTGAALSAVRITGSSVINAPDFTGVGGITVFVSGSKVFVSGSTSAQMFLTGVPSGASGLYVTFPTGFTTIPVVFTTTVCRNETIYGSTVITPSRTGFGVALSAQTTGNELSISVLAVESGMLPGLGGINTLGGSGVVNGVNLGVGDGIYKDVLSNEMRFRSIAGSGNTVIGAVSDTYYIGTLSPTGRAITSNYSVQWYDEYIYCNNTTPITLTFPSVTNRSLFNVKLINTGTVYFTGVYGQRFDGSDLYVVVGQYSARKIHTVGGQWYIW